MSSDASPHSFKALPGGLRLEQVLEAQLALLTSYVPVSQWLVADSTEFTEPVHLYGEFCVGPLWLAGFLLPSQGWSTKGMPAYFSWRRSESRSEIQGQPVCVIKVPLSAGSARKACRQVLVGVVGGQLAPPVIDPADHHRISLCLDSLAQFFELLEQLQDANRKLLEVRESSSRDPLTKALNRWGWNDRLRALQADDDVAIVFIDVDFLKEINDTQGHGAGDRLLQSLVQIANGLLRREDCLARIGGDEFAVMIKAANRLDADMLQERLRKALSEAGIFVSMGAAFKSEAGTLVKALRLADARMYKEKRAKRQPRLEADRVDI